MGSAGVLRAPLPLLAQEDPLNEDFVIALDGLGVLAWAYPEGIDSDKLTKRNFPDGKPAKDTIGGALIDHPSAMQVTNLN
eukprot:709081-Pyramimonas_sp.AAC.1